MDRNSRKAGNRSEASMGNVTNCSTSTGPSAGARVRICTCTGVQVGDRIDRQMRERPEAGGNDDGDGHDGKNR